MPFSLDIPLPNGKSSSSHGGSLWKLILYREMPSDEKRFREWLKPLSCKGTPGISRRILRLSMRWALDRLPLRSDLPYIRFLWQAWQWLSLKGETNADWLYLGARLSALAQNDAIAGCCLELIAGREDRRDVHLLAYAQCLDELGKIEEALRVLAYPEATRSADPRIHDLRQKLMMQNVSLPSHGLF